MDKAVNCQILKVKGTEVTFVQDTIVVEYALSISLNGRPYVNLLCSPEYMDELVLGYLFSEGIIRSVTEIKSISCNEQKRTADVRLENGDVFTLNAPVPDAVRTVTTACGKAHSIAYHVFNDAALMPLTNDTKFKSTDIMEKAVQFGRESELFIQTGGVHSSALYNRETELFFAEDIGRHNAFDKVIGFALKSGTDLTDKIILTSGRIPSDMVIKAINARIPVLVSRSAPTQSAIELAEKYDLTLIGFARANRMNIYAGQHRIEF